MAADIKALFDDSWTRVTLTITGFTGVTHVQVVRVALDGVETVIRAGAEVPLVSGGAVIEDNEAPLDIGMYYKATQVKPPTGTPMTAMTASEQSMLSHGFSWLKDPAQPANNLRLNYVQGLPTISRKARAGVFDIIDRQNPVVVTAKRQSLSATLTFTTFTKFEFDSVVKLINRGEILLLSTPPSFGIGNVYVHVGDVDEERIALGDVRDWTRRWTLPVLVVDRPFSITTTAPLERWSDVRQTWLTWDALYAANLTWDQLKALPAGATAPA